MTWYRNVCPGFQIRLHRLLHLLRLLLPTEIPAGKHGREAEHMVYINHAVDAGARTDLAMRDPYQARRFEARRLHHDKYRMKGLRAATCGLPNRRA